MMTGTRETWYDRKNSMCKGEWTVNGMTGLRSLVIMYGTFT